MLEVTCPICRSHMKARHPDELVRQVQAHSAKAHGGIPTADLVLAAATRRPDGLGSRLLRAAAKEIVGAVEEPTAGGKSQFVAGLIRQALGTSVTPGPEHPAVPHGNAPTPQVPQRAGPPNETAPTGSAQGPPNRPRTGSAGQPTAPAPQQRGKLTEAELELERVKRARRETERLSEARLEAEKLEKAKQSIQTQAEDLQAFSNMQNMLHQMRMGIIRNIHN